MKKDDGNLKEGWLRQIHRSAGGGDNLLLNASLFSPTTYKKLMKLDWNKLLYRREGLGKDNTYETGLSRKGWITKFSAFKDSFITTRDTNKQWQSITNPGEQLYKLVYDALSKLYHFN